MPIVNKGVILDSPMHRKLARPPMSLKQWGMVEDAQKCVKELGYGSRVVVIGAEWGYTMLVADREG